jgi:subtilase family serine protease
MRQGRAPFLASIAAITTLAGALAAVAVAPASAAAAPSVALPTSAAAPLPVGAVRLGALPAQARLTVDVALNLGNEAGLDALLDGIADPQSPYYHHFLARNQFGPQFGLSLAQVGQVTNALRELGLDPGSADAARLEIPVTATAAALDRAFRITMTDFRLPGGRVAYASTSAPMVPASIAPYVEGVLGLDDVYLNQRLDQSAPASIVAAAGPRTAQPAAAGPVPCEAVTDAAISVNGYTANEFAAHYFMTTLYTMGDLGRGVRVAVAELEPNLPSDIAKYKSCYGIGTKVNYITVTPGVGAGAGEGEAALDIENIAGLAPDATIDDYQAPNTTTTALLDIATRVLDKDADQVLSISWGMCEAHAGSALLAHYQTTFKALNAEGITVVAATGDSGPTGCYNPAVKPPAKELSPETPATSNYVIAVGGTKMQNAGQLAPETAWNGPDGAGGGGVSALCMPRYQDLHQLYPYLQQITGMITDHSKRQRSCVSGNDPNGYLRQVPDVSADASKASPYLIYYDGGWHSFWGTSTSTTLVAAEAALIDASPYCSPKGWDSGPAGLLPQDLYDGLSVNNLYVYLASRPLVVYDITKGNTDDRATGYTGGLYPATKGYDMATGLGAPLLTGTGNEPTYQASMSTFMCQGLAKHGLGNISTVSVSPTHARAGKAVTVTIRGTGYLEIRHTETLEIYTNNATKFLTEPWASCSSHTTCTVTLPAEKAGTYQLEMNVANFLPCTHGCQAYATFRFVAAPHKST